MSGINLPALSPAATPDPVQARAMRNETRLREAAQGFEALFLSQVLKSARNTSFGDSLVDSSANRTTQSLLDSKLTEIGAGRAGLGLSEAIYRQFSAHLGKTQE